MTVEGALYTMITGNTSLATLIDNRVYPLVVPDGCTYPAVAYQQISIVHTKNHSGPDDVLQVRMQLTIHAEGYDTARTVLKALRDRLDGYVGIVSDVDVKEIEVQNMYDGYDYDSGLAVIRMDLIIRYKEL